MPGTPTPGAAVYGPHLEEYEDYTNPPRRGSRSGPEGGARQAVKQVPAETNPATLASTSTAGTARKDVSSGALRLDGYK